jgi:hypothetical protein
LSVEARQIFKDHNVQVVSMHPHTTHVFCVLDVAIFATFKRKLYSIFKKKSIPGLAVSREILAGWMRTAYRKATKDRVDPKTGETFNPSVRGFAKAEWDKQQAAQKKAQKEADKAAQAVAAAAERAEREAELAAVEPKAKKARVAAKAPAAKAPPKAANGNLYAKHYAAAGLKGGKRGRD